jgi:glucokinase
MILAGDVGGSKTLLGLFGRAGRRLKLVREESFPSRDYPSLASMIAEFLHHGKQKVDRLAVGVAGPVVNGRSHVVNLRWPVDAGKLAREFDLPQVQVLNDLEAMAWGIAELPPSKLVSLTPGLRPRAGNAALIAAGTGLGMSHLVREGERFLPQASEGGHQAFSPRNDLEIDLFRFMLQRYDRVSVERIIAGPGFSEIYRFLVESGRGRETKRMRNRLAEAVDPNAEITDAALAREDATASKALDLFVSMFGAVVGDLALITKATGGCFVGGGIAPKILPRIREGEFLRAFRDKGRLTPLMQKIPVRVILEPRTGLIGAAASAAAQDKRSR